MNYKEYVKSQVSERDWKVLETMHLNLSDSSWADLALDFVNFGERRKREIPFLLAQLREYHYPRVFDACLGTGATSIGLLTNNEGLEFKVDSNEIDEVLKAIALQQAKKLGVRSNLTSVDWRDLRGDRNFSYKAVLCLGNALTYLFKRKDQLAALRGFGQILQPGGKLIIDERNYAEHFLAPKAQFKWSGEVVYCGKDKVSARPVHISPSMIVMEYHHKEKGLTAHLALYPFKKGEMCGLLKEAGFRDIQVFGDYKSRFNPKEPEFITYVARKGV